MNRNGADHLLLQMQQRRSWDSFGQLLLRKSGVLSGYGSVPPMNTVLLSRLPRGLTRKTTSWPLFASDSSFR